MGQDIARYAERLTDDVPVDNGSLARPPLRQCIIRDQVQQ